MPINALIRRICPENRGGSDGRGNNRGAQRGNRGSTYNVYGPHFPTHSLQHIPTSHNASTASEVIPPESYPYFVGVLYHVSHWISTVQPIEGSSIMVAPHTVRSFVLCFIN